MKPRLAQTLSDYHPFAPSFVVVLVLERNLLKEQRRIVKHSKLQMPARSKDMPLPIAFQGIGNACRKEMSAFVVNRPAFPVIKYADGSTTRTALSCRVQGRQFPHISFLTVASDAASASPVRCIPRPGYELLHRLCLGLPYRF
jgi:hypothetical protein